MSFSDELAVETANREVPFSFAMARITFFLLLLTAIAVLADRFANLPTVVDGQLYSVTGLSALVALVALHLLFRLRVRSAIINRQNRE